MASTSQSRRPTVSDFPVGPTARTQEQLRRDRVLAIAHGEALKAGVVGTIVTGALKKTFVVHILFPSSASWLDCRSSSAPEDSSR